MSIRKAIVDGGVSYHHALMQPGEPFADYDRLDVLRLAQVALEEYHLLVVPRSVDSEALHARRYQIARFLDQGGVLVTFGEQPTAWFPGSAWEPECAEDVDEPVVTSGHPLLAGMAAAQLEWHPRRQSWCCHGHFRAPAGAEVLVANRRGDAWLYIDRASSPGVILAASNLDPDTHTYHGSTVARALLARMLAWAEDEAERAQLRSKAIPRRIAALYSGVYFQRAFYRDPEFCDRFSVVPAAELASLPLTRYAALWVPRESNQHVLMQERARIEDYLQQGGTLISFEEANQEWLPRARWAHRTVDVDTLATADHPLVAGLTPEDVRWHGHGAFEPYPEADIVIADGAGDGVLYVDERSFPGRILAGTLDPDCHAGFGSGRTRPLLRRIVAWALAEATVIGTASDDAVVCPVRTNSTARPVTR